MVHISQKLNKKGYPLNNSIEIGIDLIDYNQNYEWDIMSVRAKRIIKKNNYLLNNYNIELSFKIIIRRKTLFHTFNIIIPLIGVSLLTVFVFYLPIESSEKLTLSTFIIVTITFFVPYLYESIPPTSLQVPLLSKYTFFSFILTSMSILAHIIVLNIYYRFSTTHVMSNWIRILFVNILSKMLRLNKLNFS